MVLPRPLFAVMVAVVVTVTDVVVAVNVPVVDPAGIVIDAGTVALAVFEESEMVSPPDGAMLLRVTVPSVVVPPATVVGLNVTDEI